MIEILVNLTCIKHPSIPDTKAGPMEVRFKTGFMVVEKLVAFKPCCVEVEVTDKPTLKYQRI